MREGFHAKQLIPAVHTPSRWRNYGQSPFVFSRVILGSDLPSHTSTLFTLAVPTLPYHMHKRYLMVQIPTKRSRGSNLWRGCRYGRDVDLRSIPHLLSLGLGFGSIQLPQRSRRLVVRRSLLLKTTLLRCRSAVELSLGSIYEAIALSNLVNLLHPYRLFDPCERSIM